jgi:hypothetical protein
MSLIALALLAQLFNGADLSNLSDGVSIPQASILQDE